MQFGRIQKQMLAKFLIWITGFFIKKPPHVPVILDPNKKLVDYTNEELVARYGKGINEPAKVYCDSQGCHMDRKSFMTHPRMRYYMDYAKEEAERVAKERIDYGKDD